MSKTVKVAISLPEELLAEADKASEREGASRSAIIRRALADYLRAEQEREWDREYVEAYRRMPETREEVAVSEATSQYGWEETPWENEE
jgi:metal-responsive CopG/Arc/MetJ family transcriptional regulator